MSDTPVEKAEHHDAEELFEHDYHPGLLFASFLLFGLSLFLLYSLDTETKWFNRVKLPLQPRFWPAVVLIGMSFFSGAAFITHVIKWRRRAREASLSKELIKWFLPAEYALWFITYAASIPFAGYLLSTVIFMPLLGYRVGIRKVKTLGLLIMLAIVTVLFFKTGLAVNIPAGMIYDFAPDDIRNFLIKNF